MSIKVVTQNCGVFIVELVLFGKKTEPQTTLIISGQRNVRSAQPGVAVGSYGL